MTKTADSFQMIEKLDAKLSERSLNIACDRYLKTFRIRGGPLLCGDNMSLIGIPTDGDLPSSGLQDARMLVVDPSIADNKVSITYSGSGIGYAGAPSEDDAGNSLADAAPVVTVSINRAQMRALFLRADGYLCPASAIRKSSKMATG